MSTFEHELRAWIERVYQSRASLAARRVEHRVLLILDGERRWLIPLSAGVVIGAALAPVVGPITILTSLVALYVGAMASGYRTMRRVEGIERSFDPDAEAVTRAELAWATRPALEAETRARLVRIMNLSRAAGQGAARGALMSELAEASAQEPLAGWALVRDAEELLRADPAALA